MNGSLVPANTKKATLILGILRPMPDLAILIGGVLISVILLMTLGDASTWLLIIACIPMLLGAFLIMPLPNYHNVLCCLQSIFRFYYERRKYVWKGWCIYNEFNDRK
ncbi:MAG: hypothetical protein IJZ77_01360 [Bacilli bacterium]|nr:hypothetical protein [Bacilli bacterium]